MKRSLFTAVFTLSLGLSAVLNAQEKPAGASLEYFASPATGAAAPAYSEAVRLGDTLYVSGQIGAVTGKGLVAGGIEAETRQVLENMKAVLERHGSSMDQVTKCTVFLADIKDFTAFNAIYREYFKTSLPARSTVAVTALVAGARVEIDCIAFVPAKK
ncbi:MAG: RidA family protein [Nibricoccus sp.]